MSSNEFLCLFPGCKESRGTIELFLLHSRRHYNFDFEGKGDFNSVLSKSQGIYYCSLCNFRSENFLIFGEHLRQHIFAESYKCDRCDKDIKTIHDLKLHFKYDHPNIEIAFQFQKNHKILNLFLDVILQDNGNIYFLYSFNKYIVFMKGDTSFWFLIFVASRANEMNKIFLSKNMHEIIDHKLLELFPGGFCVSDDSCANVEHIETIKNKASKFLNFVKARSDKKVKKDVGRYKFDGCEFECTSCDFATQDSNIFRGHIWKEIHDVGECDHMQVKSCIFEGQQLCSIVESTLYRLMFLLNDFQPSERVSSGEEPIKKYSELVHGKVGAKRGFSGEIETQSEVLHKKFRRTKHASVISNDNNDVDFDYGEPPVLKPEINYNVTGSSIDISTPKSNLSSISKSDNISIKCCENKQSPKEDKFHMFLFGKYLRESASNEHLVELVHDVTPLRHVCQNCDFSCSSPIMLKFHKKSCFQQSTKDGYACPRCRQCCLSLNSLLKHLSFHLGSTLLTLYSCNYCGECFTTVLSAGRHLKERHPCEHSLRKTVGITTTSKTFHFLERVYKCFACGSGQFWCSNYVNHLRKKHGLSHLASYLYEHYDEYYSGVVMFPKHLLFDDASSDRSSSDLSFDDRVKVDLRRVTRSGGGSKAVMTDLNSLEKSLENLKSKVNVFNERMSSIFKGSASETRKSSKP